LWSTWRRSCGNALAHEYQTFIVPRCRTALESSVVTASADQSRPRRAPYEAPCCGTSPSPDSFPRMRRAALLGHPPVPPSRSLSLAQSELAPQLADALLGFHGHRRKRVLGDQPLAGTFRAGVGLVRARGVTACAACQLAIRSAGPECVLRSLHVATRYRQCARESQVRAKRCGEVLRAIDGAR
jgi:hypothetical protein